MVHPETGNEIPGAPTRTTTRAYLSQRPTENLSSAIQISGAQNTTISLFSLLVPPDAPLRSDTVVIDEAGNRYEVDGAPAQRRTAFAGKQGVVYQSAALRMVSDLKGVS